MCLRESLISKQGTESMIIASFYRSSLRWRQCQQMGAHKTNTPRAGPFKQLRSKLSTNNITLLHLWLWRPEPKLYPGWASSTCSSFSVIMLLIFSFSYSFLAKWSIPCSTCIFFVSIRAAFCLFSTVFNLDTALSHLLTFGRVVVKTVLWEFMPIMSVGGLPLGGEQTQFCESWGKTSIEVIFCGPWGLAFLHVICNYLMITIALKSGFLYLRLNSLSNAQKCCDWCQVIELALEPIFQPKLLYILTIQ